MEVNELIRQLIDSNEKKSESLYRCLTLIEFILADPKILENELIKNEINEVLQLCY